MTLARFGIIGDVHAEERSLEAALEHLRGERVERVLCVGDLADGRGDLRRCVRLLAEHRVATVRGNHDRWLTAGEARDLPRAHKADSLDLDTREFIAGLPPTLRLDTIAGPLLLCHAFGTNDMVSVDKILDFAPDEAMRRWEHERILKLIPDDVVLVVCGHSHHRGVRRLGRVTKIDAGTLHFADTPGFGVVDLRERVVQWFDVDDDAQVRPAEREPTGSGW
jgi:predicted phosphodiesterase